MIIDRRRWAAAVAYATLFGGLLLAGCATLRIGGEEHYIGPVLYRYRPADSATGVISQVSRLGFWVEAGEQWGVALGVAERMAAVPSRDSTGSDAPATVP